MACTLDDVLKARERKKPVVIRRSGIGRPREDTVMQEVGLTKTVTIDSKQRHKPIRRLMAW